MPNLSELLHALAEKSVRRGSFTLASGAQSDLYVEADGGRVAFAIVLVDRQEQNGRANIEARGGPVVAVFNRQEVLAADARKQPHSAAA